MEMSSYSRGFDMRSRIWFAVVVLSIECAVNAGIALSAGGGAIEVAQPLVAYQGIEVSRVSYLKGRPFQLIPGYSVHLIGEPSCVCDERGESINRNAASFLGIKARYDGYHAATSMLLGDTLHVYMDLSKLKPLTEDLERQLNGWSVDAVVKATAECILLTAYDCRFGIADPGSGRRVETKYIWLEVQGSAEYMHLGGVFSLEELGPLPRRRLFN